jgi:predicted nucleic acid-binding protein
VFISAHRAQAAIQHPADLRISRYPHFIFLSKIWQYRHGLSAYDAAYARLAAVAGRAVLVEVSFPFYQRDKILQDSSCICGKFP